MLIPPSCCIFFSSKVIFIILDVLAKLRSRMLSENLISIFMVILFTQCMRKQFFIGKFIDSV